MAPVTLEQAKNFVQTDLDPFVIDGFRSVSPLLNLLTFDTAVNPAGGGGTLTYGYNRVKSPSTAAFRELNKEYEDSTADVEQKVVNLVPLGGRFEIDRVIAGIGSSAANEVKFQMEQKIKASALEFTNAVINGDTGVNASGFDGLNKALVDTTQEIKDEFDWTGTSEDAAFGVLDSIDQLTGALDGAATVLIGNSRAINKVRAAARRTNAFVSAPTGLINSNGQEIMAERVGNVYLVDAGLKPGTGDDVIATEGGTTSLYAVRLGLDGFHGVTTTGNNGLVKTWLPDFTTAGAVKSGEVEMGPLAVALKSQRAAAVLRNVKIAADAAA